MENKSSFNVFTADIGGSHIKAAVLDQDGKELTPYRSRITPKPANPENVINCLKLLSDDISSFDCLAVGFPGYVKNGVVQTAPNLGSEIWHQVDLQQWLNDAFSKPTRVLNDADLQGLGVVSGIGFEILITLGTGFGTAFLLDGKLFPHIELAHHPIVENADYDQYIGDKVLKQLGIEKWNLRMAEVLRILKIVFNYDRLYIGGGNAMHINVELADNMLRVNNEDGIRGGAKLWKSIYNI